MNVIKLANESSIRKDEALNILSKFSQLIVMLSSYTYVGKICKERLSSFT